MSIDNTQNLRLLAMDWDNTILPRHMSLFAFYVMKKGINSPIIYKSGIDPERQLGCFFNPEYTPSSTLFKEWYDNSPPFKASDIKHLITSCVEKGIKVAIVTLSRFPDAIYNMLQHMGVALEILDNIIVVCNGYTLAMKYMRVEEVVPESKNTHIDIAMQYFGLDTKQKHSVLYIDDDKHFIEAAGAIGCNTIIAKQGQAWISEAQKYVDNITNVHTVSTYLTATDILKMNIQISKQWEIDNPIVREQRIESEFKFVVDPLTLKKKSSVSDVKYKASDDDAALPIPSIVAEALEEVQLLAKADDI